METKTFVSVLFLIFSSVPLHTGAQGNDNNADITPRTWPERFHALLYMNLGSTYGDKLQVTNLWYDWPAGRNVNLIQKQLGPFIYDVEWNNGTSFYYYVINNRGEDEELQMSCRTEYFGVGIPRRDWMAGSTYLGMQYTDGFLCHVWTKVDFIWYYEDVATGRPVRWDFNDGISTHVITFEEGAVLEESWWQAPASCFSNSKVE